MNVNSATGTGQQGFSESQPAKLSGKSSDLLTLDCASETGEFFAKVERRNFPLLLTAWALDARQALAPDLAIAEA